MGVIGAFHINSPMCNLYSETASQNELRQHFRLDRDLTQSALFSPIIRLHEGSRQLEMMRWGMPSPPQYGGPPVTNIRNVQFSPLAALARG